MAAGDFQDQVETLTSTTVTDLNGLTNLLTSGATEIINRIKKLSPGDIGSFTAESTHAVAGGLALGGADVVHVARESGTPGDFNAAQPISANSQYEASDPSSLNFMSSISPAYFIQAGKVHLIPDTSAIPGNSAKIVKITYPVVDYDNLTITNFPDAYEYLVALYASFHHIMGLMQAQVLPTASFPVVPETPALVDKTILIPGVLSLPPTPGGRDIDFTDLPSLPIYSSPILNLSTIALPADISISASIPAPPSFTDTRIEFSSSAPVYSSPVFQNLQDTRPSLSLATLTEDAAILFLPDPPTITAVTIAALGTAPSYTKPTAPTFAFDEVAYPEITYNIPTVPIAPELESAAVQIDLTTLTSNFPSYMPPDAPDDADFTTVSQVLDSIELPPNVTPPSLGSVEVYPTAEFDWTLPSQPLAPTFDWSGLTQVLTAMELPADPLFPVLEVQDVPTLTWDFPTTPLQPSLDWSGVTQIVSTITLPSGIVIPPVDISVFPTISWTFPGKPVPQEANWADLERWINIEEDPEMAEIRISAIAERYAAYGSDVEAFTSMINGEITKNQGVITSWSEEVNAKLSKFTGELTGSIERYTGEATAEATIVNTQVAVLNAQIQKISQKNTAEVQLFQSQITSYQSTINGIITANQGRLQSWNQEWQTKLAKYQAEVSATASEYSAKVSGRSQAAQSQVAIAAGQLRQIADKSAVELQTFTAETQAWQTRVDGNSRRNSQIAANWQIEWNTKVQKFATELGALINLYEGEIRGKSASSGAQVQIYQAQLSKVNGAATTNTQLYQGRLTGAQNLFNSSVEAYKTELEVLIKNADLATGKDGTALAKYAQELDSFQKESAIELSTTKAKVEEWAQKLVTLTDSSFKVAQLEMSRYQSEIQDAANVFAKEQSAYEADLQHKLEQARLSDATAGKDIAVYQAEVQAYGTEIQSIANESNISLQVWSNEMQTLAQKYSVDYQAWAGDYSASIQKYQVDIQDSLNKFQESVLQYQTDLQISLKNVDMQEADNAHELQRFQSELQNYQGNMQQQTTEYQVNLTKLMEKWKLDVSTEIAAYQANMQEKQAEFSSELSLWQAEFNKATQKFQLESGYDMTEYQGSVQTATSEYGAEIQRFGSDQQDVSRQNQELMGLFQVELAKFQGESQTEQQRWTVEFQNANTEYERLGSTYSQLKQEYDGAFALMQPPQQQQERRR